MDAGRSGSAGAAEVAVAELAGEASVVAVVDEGRADDAAAGAWLRSQGFGGGGAMLAARSTGRALAVCEVGEGPRRGGEGREAMGAVEVGRGRAGVGGLRALCGLRRCESCRTGSFVVKGSGDNGPRATSAQSRWLAPHGHLLSRAGASLSRAAWASAGAGASSGLPSPPAPPAGRLRSALAPLVACAVHAQSPFNPTRPCAVRLRSPLCFPRPAFLLSRLSRRLERAVYRLVPQRASREGER